MTSFPPVGVPLRNVAPGDKYRHPLIRFFRRRSLPRGVQVLLADSQRVLTPTARGTKPVRTTTVLETISAAKRLGGAQEVGGEAVMVVCRIGSGSS
jgi:hypothetical protein